MVVYGKNTLNFSWPMREKLNERLHWFTEARWTEVSLDITSWLQLYIIASQKNNLWQEITEALKITQYPFREQSKKLCWLSNKIQMAELKATGVAVSVSPVDGLEGTNQIRLWPERKESECPHSLTSLWFQIFGTSVFKI